MKNLLILCLLIPCIAQAAVYKCTDAKGAVSYSSSPCKKGSPSNFKLHKYSPSSRTYANPVYLGVNTGSSKIDEKKRIKQLKKEREDRELMYSHRNEMIRGEVEDDYNERLLRYRTTGVLNY